MIELLLSLAIGVFIIYLVTRRNKKSEGADNLGDYLNDITKGLTGKASYGRGIGGLPPCTSAQDYDAGLCYPKCKPGFSGVGPMCWEINKGISGLLNK